MKKNFFTMLEMLIVVAILLLLSTGLFVLGSNLMQKYYLMQGKMEFLKIQNAITAYKSATGNFPPDYMSSSHNEDNVKGGVGRWYMVFTTRNLEFASVAGKYAKAKEYYDKATYRPKALVKIRTSSQPFYAVFFWDWGSDIGGELPDGSGGFVCPEKEPCSPDDFPRDAINAKPIIFPVQEKLNDASGELEPVSTGDYFDELTEIDVTGVFKCKYGAKGSDPRVLSCADDPNDTSKIYSCGWHSFSADDWEGGYNQKESSKALYDYLCRPMKGRMRDGVAVSPKFSNSKPFIDVSNKLVRPTGAPGAFDTCGNAIKNNPDNYKLYGEGLFGLTDSFELIDVWGSAYLYVSSAPEYLVPNHNAVRPYQSFTQAESQLTSTDGYQRDLFPPKYNRTSYDLASNGPDKMAVNYIPRDFKLGGGGYRGNMNIIALMTESAGGINAETDKQYMYGQKGPSGLLDAYVKLPSEELFNYDYDNDNISNFNSNNDD